MSKGLSVHLSGFCCSENKNEINNKQGIDTVMRSINKTGYKIKSENIIISNFMMVRY